MDFNARPSVWPIADDRPRIVSRSIPFQETKARTLAQDIPQIVKSIEGEVTPIIEKIKEAERQAEIQRLERLAEEERCRQEEGRRRIALSVKESRDRFEQVIQAWSKVISLEQFCHGIDTVAAVAIGC